MSFRICTPHPVLLSALLAASAVWAGRLEAADEGFVSMFNGKDLTGWKGEPGWWTVEDGAITGTTTARKPLKRATYLFWDGKAADFEFRCLFRLKDGNSGVNFRSRELPNWDVFGYQADLEAGPTYTGILYEVNGRAVMTLRGQKVTYAASGKKEVSTFADAKELQKHIKPNQWNEYVITARGPRIVTKINGATMTELVDHDPKALREGIFSLQLHPGPPMKVQFKELRLKRLAGEE